MYKLWFNIKKFYFIFFTILFFGYLSSVCQEPVIVKSAKEYRKITETDSLQTMIELKSLIPSLIYDLHYATKNNFTGKKLYAKGEKTFLRLEAVNALKKVQLELEKLGYGLKIWDAYRPYSITKKMWDLIGDERYVANPARGSNHNRGLAIDITLMKDGNEVDMGTGFDNFGDSAHHSFKNLSGEVLQHRKLLKETMAKHGFTSFETEWWHYSFPNNKNYALLDVKFSKLD